MKFPSYVLSKCTEKVKRKSKDTAFIAPIIFALVYVQYLYPKVITEIHIGNSMNYNFKVKKSLLN